LDYLDTIGLLLHTRDVFAHSVVITEVEAFAIQNDQTLFSKLAAVFESAVIHLLTRDEIAGVPKVTLEAFQRSYASTAFRCRFPNCSKSFAGFASPELRTQHEATHFRRVYCRVANCQWSEIGFKEKNGLDAHTRKHHNEKSVFSIPLKVRRTLEDRAESECKDPPPTPPAPAPFTNSSHALGGTIEEEEESTIKCICGFTYDYGNTVLCEKCDTRQHIACYYPCASEILEVHKCNDCHPGDYLYKKAAAEK